MRELRQTTEHSDYMRLIDWQVERSDRGVFAYVKRLPISRVGVMKIQRVPLDKLDFKWISQVARRYRVITTYVEVDRRVYQPVKQAEISQTNLTKFKLTTQYLRQHGYRPIPMGMVASKTQAINLKQSETELLAAMKPKTRYNISLAQRRGLKAIIVDGADLTNNEPLMKTFLGLIKTNNRRVNYWGGQEAWIRAHISAFGAKAYVVLVIIKPNDFERLAKNLASHEERQVNWRGQTYWLTGAALFLGTQETSYYGHNGSTVVGRASMAPSLAVWEGMAEGKRRGLKNLDFDGVYDERFPVKRWLGYTRFKNSFGGDYLWYPPAYVQWFSGWRKAESLR